MLIRSQNKEDLVALDDMSVVNSNKRFGFFEIWIYKNNAHCNMGEYASKQKALKVLDMIEKTYTGTLWTDSHFDSNACSNVADIIANRIVFEMPSDAEVEG